MMEFDYETLETKGAIEYNDKIGNQYMFSASHPSYDPETGEHFNCLGEPGPRGKFYFYKLQDESFQRKFIGFIKAPKNTYFHSFALTKKYFIFIEQPLELNIFKLMFGRLLNIPYAESFNWKPEKGTKFHLMDRKTGQLQTVRSEAFFFFHTINAYDKEDEVIIDICLYDNPDIIKLLYLDQLKKNGIPSEGRAKVSRVTLSPFTQKVKIETISKERMDLPTFNFNKACKEHRYIYGLGYHEGDEVKVNNQLVKIDSATGQSKTWYEHGTFPSEPLFVQSPYSLEEDGGVMLSVVLDTQKQRSFLLILDAQSFKEIARAEAPSHLPIGLHGMFYFHGK